MSESQPIDQSGQHPKESQKQAAENKVAENATRVTELEQNLQEARKEVGEQRESDEQLMWALERTEKALKKKHNAAIGTSSNQDLTTKIDGLRSKFGDAYKQADEAFESGYSQTISEDQSSDQSEVITIRNLLKREGYQRGVLDCEQKDQLLEIFDTPSDTPMTIKAFFAVSDDMVFLWCVPGHHSGIHDRTNICFPYPLAQRYRQR